MVCALGNRTREVIFGRDAEIPWDSAGALIAMR